MAKPAASRTTVRELIATNPQARRRLGRAYADLLAAVLASIAALTVLALWAVSRRARRRREALAPRCPGQEPEIDSPP